MGARHRLCVVPLVLALSFAMACGQSKPPAESATPTEPLFKPVDPAQVTDALTTPGVARYWGVLPCADCAGIRTELMLVQDPKTGEPQTYELIETYLGSMGREEKPNTTRGKWTVATGVASDTAAATIVLDGGGRPELSRRFERLNDRELRQLDRQGKRITSTLNYVLTRVSQIPMPMPLPAGTAPPAAPGGATPTAMVTDMASGWPVNLTAGQEMTARLAVDPSGARWSLRPGTDGGVLALQGAPATETPVGQPAVEVFHLRAARAGRTTVTFDLKKGAEATPLKSVSYPVTVQ